MKRPVRSFSPHVLRVILRRHEAHTSHDGAHLLPDDHGSLVTQLVTVVGHFLRACQGSSAIQTGRAGSHLLQVGQMWGETQETDADLHLLTTITTRR